MRASFSFIALVALAGSSAILASCATPAGGVALRGPETSLPAGVTREIVLSGELTRADHQTYREVPFTVPPGVAQLIVDLSYGGRDQRTVVDLGLRDPSGQRGWSGGNKSRIVIGESGSTPSYRSGPIQPGTWVLVLGVPNIREGVTSAFEAKVTFRAHGAADRLSTGEARWMRGDFHTHTAHSDASCDNGEGVRVPCPVHRTLDAARAAGLDFVAVTDHNTLTQLASIRELQPEYPGLLVIAGSEVTTFHGHANAIGLETPLEFQLGSARAPDLSAIQTAVRGQRAILSINHPSQPTGEACMGCGWTVAPTDFARIDAIEITNGATARLGLREGAVSGIAFWEAQLNEGHRITGIAGSDNHDPTDTAGARQSPVGTPATVVWSIARTQADILEGVRSGRVFIDFRNRPERTLDVEARLGGAAAPMGGTLLIPPDAVVEFSVVTSGVDSARVEIVSGGVEFVQRADGQRTASQVSLRLKPGARHGWIRANVRDGAGKLQLIGNPVYVVEGFVQTTPRAVSE